ncbi:MAG: uroporphyrinogen-III C-methyltransferase [Deltaproteobacteria bacterium]|nr:uroporphyrinogen-III C-methyltransferase [Deltaproteobacteria bacterium]
MKNEGDLGPRALKATGTVYLVGAGPGDPGLLTLRGAELLGRADVVVYDYLAAQELLDLAPIGARRIYVGKSGSNHTLKQDEINELLVTEALAGNAVVRLKGGDPYVFGRGAEEALRLAEAGVAFEVVPGISSTIAAAGAAGIPLTHRDMASQIGILTGHEKPGKTNSALDYGALARLGTLSVVMGAENLPNILERLISAGKDPSTPAALVEWGATPRQRVVASTVSRLADEAKAAGLSAPALLVVGEVVGLRDKLNWFEKRPLFGKRILVTRTREQAGRLSGALRELGAEVLERPAIEIGPIEPNPPLAAALANLSDYGYLALTSPNGASLFLKALFASGLDSRALYGLKIVAIGPGTAEVLAGRGLKVDCLPKSFVAEGLVELFAELPRARVLLARAKEARDVLVLGLRNLGFELELVPLYETLIADWSGFENLSFIGYDSASAEEKKRSVSPNPIDLATLTSASVAEGLARHVPEGERPGVAVVSIGPITTKAARALGFNVVAEAKRATIEDLAAAAVACLADRPKPAL